MERDEMQLLLDQLRLNPDVSEGLFRLLEAMFLRLPFPPEEVPTRPNRRTPPPFARVEIGTDGLAARVDKILEAGKDSRGK